MLMVQRFRAALALGLVTVFASAAGCALSATPEEAAVAEADDAYSAPPFVPLGALLCTMSGSFGRQWAYVKISSPGVCLRVPQGGDAPDGFSSCHQRAYQELGCSTVVTAP
jgi:hypothetical protein